MGVWCSPARRCRRSGPVNHLVVDLSRSGTSLTGQGAVAVRRARCRCLVHGCDLDPAVPTVEVVVRTGTSEQAVRQQFGPVGTVGRTWRWTPCDVPRDGIRIVADSARRKGIGRRPARIRTIKFFNQQLINFRAGWSSGTAARGGVLRSLHPGAIVDSGCWSSGLRPAVSRPRTSAWSREPVPSEISVLRRGAHVDGNARYLLTSHPISRRAGGVRKRATRVPRDRGRWRPPGAGHVTPCVAAKTSGVGQWSARALFQTTRRGHGGSQIRDMLTRFVQRCEISGRLWPAGRGWGAAGRLALDADALVTGVVAHGTWPTAQDREATPRPRVQSRGTRGNCRRLRRRVGVVGEGGTQCDVDAARRHPRPRCAAVTNAAPTAGGPPLRGRGFAVAGRTGAWGNAGRRFRPACTSSRPPWRSRTRSVVT